MSEKVKITKKDFESIYELIPDIEEKKVEESGVVDFDSYILANDSNKEKSDETFDVEEDYDLDG